MWDKLCETHESSWVENVLRLQTELESVWKEPGKSMNEYIRSLRSMFSKLQGAGSKVDEPSKLVKLLGGLPMSDYEAIRMNLAFQSGMTFEKACIKLETYEKDCQASKGMTKTLGEANFTKKSVKK